jgi:chemotaxis protein MotB
MRLDQIDVGNEEDRTNPFYISLSDLMILLCVFFSMLVSVSEIEIGSFEKLRSSFSGSTKNTLVELSQTLKTIAYEDPGIPGVNVELATDGVRIDLDTVALFETGSAQLKVNALESITPLLEKVLATPYRVDVEGHTDDQPYWRLQQGRLETNWSLSGRRASSVVHYLLMHGFASDRLRIVGYASHRPKVSVQDITDPVMLQLARKENRRVSLLVR